MFFLGASGLSFQHLLVMPGLLASFPSLGVLCSLDVCGHVAGAVVTLDSSSLCDLTPFGVFPCGSPEGGGRRVSSVLVSLGQVTRVAHLLGSWVGFCAFPLRVS